MVIRDHPCQQEGQDAKIEGMPKGSQQEEQPLTEEGGVPQEANQEAGE